MLNNRKELVKRFLKEGFTHRTLSSFSDTQLKTLSKKLFNEAETTTVKKTTYNKSEVDKMKQDDGGLNVDGTVTPNEDGSVTVTTNEEKNNEEKNIETDPMGNPDVDIDGEPLLVEKLASKMTKSDYEKLPEYVNEQEALESWITSLVESKELPTITKGNFIKTIKENLNGDVDSPYTIGTEAQQDSFADVIEIAREMAPPMNVEVDGFDDGGHMNGYLSFW